MNNFFSNFNVVVAKFDPSYDIQANTDNLGGFLIQVNSEGEWLKEIFQENKQLTFTKKQKRHLKLAAIEAFLKRQPKIRCEMLPHVSDESKIKHALKLLAKDAAEVGEI